MRYIVFKSILATSINPVSKLIQRPAKGTRPNWPLAKKHSRTGGDQHFPVSIDYLGPDLNFLGPYFPSLEAIFLVVIPISNWAYLRVEGGKFYP